MGESANDGIRVTNTLDRMRGMSISWSRIAQDMQVSRSWLKDWKWRHDNIGPCSRSYISDADLDSIMYSLVQDHPSRGEVFAWSELQNNHNVYITRDRLRQVC
jgi:hypothetical protein